METQGPCHRKKRAGEVPDPYWHSAEAFREPHLLLV
jgi:hypothetical protein